MLQRIAQSRALQQLNQQQPAGDIADAHRLALDHPDAVQRMLLLDIAPTLAMYENTSEAFARAYWHWFFLIQKTPFPERLINANPAGYVRDVIEHIVVVKHDYRASYEAVRKAATDRVIERNSAVQLCYVEVEEPDMHRPTGDIERLKAVLEKTREQTQNIE